jgi:hypothetical protein
MISRRTPPQLLGTCGSKGCLHRSNHDGLLLELGAELSTVALLLLATRQSSGEPVPSAASQRSFADDDVSSIVAPSLGRHSVCFFRTSSCLPAFTSHPSPCQQPVSLVSPLLRARRRAAPSGYGWPAPSLLARWSRSHGACFCRPNVA